MRKSKSLHVVLLLAILAGSLSLGVKPVTAADAAIPYPPELLDPESSCKLYFRGTYLGDNDCLMVYEEQLFPTTQGVTGFGFGQFLTDLWAENNCSLDMGLVFELSPFVVGQYTLFVDWHVVKCVELSGAEGEVGGAVRGVDEAGTLSLKQPRNGFIQYDAGTCSGVCRLSGNLPVIADKFIGEIPGTVSATLYVQLGGGTGSYLACFWGEGQIYQRISGVWQAVATSIANGMSCVAGAGDGTYAFVEN